MKEWLISNPNKIYSSAPELMADLLKNKNILEESAQKKFLEPVFEDLHDPFLFNQMKTAVARIKQAIEKNEKIVIHGDYDADGVCASAILEKVLSFCGAKNISVYLPHRDEGYGFQKSAAEYFIEQKINLIITCDCGTTNLEAIKIAKDAGLDTIVTDHHIVLADRPLPETLAFINPADPASGYPFKYLAGSGVAYKLAQALALTLKPNEAENFLKWLLGLAAISTITDMVPLLDENRTIATLGLKALNYTGDLSANFLRQTHRLGLWYLLQQAGTPLGKITTTTVEYQIGPRLNAAGRMDHANGAYKLMTTDDPSEAQTLAENLNTANGERQKLVKEYSAEALAEITSQHLDTPIFWLMRDNWPEGLLGLIASAVKEETGKPTFVFNKKGERYQASARGPKGFSLVEAMDSAKEYFLKYGGHAQAAGCSIIGADNFAQAYTALRDFTLKNKDKIMTEKLNIEAIVETDFVNIKNAEILQTLAPYGIEQREPILAIKNIYLTSLRPVGRDFQHCQMSADKMSWHFIQWQTKGVHPPLNVPLDIAFNLRVSVWQGQTQIEAVIADWREHLD